MKKKIYMTPDMVSVKVNTKSHLLEGSQVGFSSSEYSGVTHRSREGGSSWDDDEW